MGPARAKIKSKKGKKPVCSPGRLLDDAVEYLRAGELESAAACAETALAATAEGGPFELRALNLLGVITTEAGDTDAARAWLARAIELDPDGSRDERVGGGPEKFLWMAQVSEEGGHDSVAWFERGAAVLRAQIFKLSPLSSADLGNGEAAAGAGAGAGAAATAAGSALAEKRRKLAGALCAVAEVYMTDLSWEADAEARCESLVTEASLMAPDSAETWQTVASVRISQSRPEDARSALMRSLDIWRDLPAEHPLVPDFPARVSLARLLLETGMNQEAIEVVHRLVEDNDESVEAWYLGGWALYLEGRQIRAADEEKAVNGAAKGKGRASDVHANGVHGHDADGGGGGDGDSAAGGWKSSWIPARRWLTRCLQLFVRQEYEDGQLGEHAQELLDEVCAVVGPAPEGEDESEDEDEDEDGDLAEATGHGENGDEWEDEGVVDEADPAEGSSRDGRGGADDDGDVDMKQ